MFGNKAKVLGKIAEFAVFKCNLFLYFLVPVQK